MSVQPVNCSAWEDTRTRGSGKCRLGMYGGHPSHGVCMMACTHYDGPPRDRELFRALTGVSGNAVIIQMSGASHAKQKAPCAGCQSKKAKMVRWLGLRWIGTPWPKRWRWNPDIAWIEYQPSPGCGCIYKLKAAVEAFRTWRLA